MKSKLTCLFLLLAAPLLHAQATPTLMSYQGRVTDAGGVLIGNSSPVNRTVTFQLYTASSGGTTLYAETQTVTISGGEFSVLIGNGTGISGMPGPSSPATQPYKTLSDIINSGTYGSLYLGVTVDDGTAAADPEISPRQQIVSGAFALRAKVAESVAGGAVTTAMMGDGQVSTGKIASGAVDSSRIADSSIVATDIANNTITAGKLDTGTIGLWSPVGSSVYRSSGNVGIGEANPAFPLNFASSLGDKIALWGNSGGHVGFGVQGGLLQIHGGNSGDDIGFGYGSSGSFTETMRIKGNGNVGIGTNNPSYRLQINDGRLWFTTGSGNGDNGGIGGSMASNDTWRIFGYGDNNNGALYIDTYDDANEPIVFRQSSNERMRINSDGNVTVNNTLYGGAIKAGTVLGGGVLSPTFVAGGAPLGQSAGSENRLGSFGCATGNTSTLCISAYRFADGGDWTTTSMLLGMNVDDSTRVGNKYISISPNGIGINTPNPGALLHVSGSTSWNWNTGSHASSSNSSSGPQNGNPDAYTANGSYAPNNSSMSWPLTIYADGAVAGSAFIAMSDLRIKDVVGRSPTRGDLDLINQLQVTDYRLKDSAHAGTAVRKGFIAQEVRKVIPEAVSTSRNFLPDVYQLATKCRHEAGQKRLSVTVAKPHALAAGDWVRVYVDETLLETEVLEVSSPTVFVVASEKAVAKAFVYGRRVDDFHSVDYDRIFTTGVGAIQELDRKLKDESTKVASLRTKNAELEARLSALEKLSAAK